MTHYIVIFLLSFLLAGCTSSSDASRTNNAPEKSTPKREIPAFSADSAYQAIASQLAFGARVPGSPAQKECAIWLESELLRYGAKASCQKSSVTAYDGTHLPCYNIFGSFNPEARQRVLLISHWDSRHVADSDPDPAKRTQPVAAANDGASGVGVLLEIARQAGLKQPRLGIDIFFTDVEDYGAPDSWKGQHTEEQWALGTQQWCHHVDWPGHRATYGILLDMVGASDATFYREYFSDQYARDVVDFVWNTANKLGYGQLFINQRGGAITDDHVFVNRQTRIPTIDIIDTRMEGDGTFYPHWHTTEDTLDKISKETLQKVGNVLMHLIY